MASVREISQAGSLVFFGLLILSDMEKRESPIQVLAQSSRPWSWESLKKVSSAIDHWVHSCLFLEAWLIDSSCRLGSGFRFHPPPLFIVPRHLQVIGEAVQQEWIYPAAQVPFSLHCIHTNKNNRYSTNTNQAEMSVRAGMGERTKRGRP